MSYDEMLWTLRSTAMIIVAMCGVFTLSYGFRSNWTQTRAGKSIMALVSMVGLAWLMAVILSFAPTLPLVWNFRIQLVTHLLTIAAMSYVLYALFYNQMLDRRNETDRATGSLTREPTRD